MVKWQDAGGGGTSILAEGQVRQAVLWAAICAVVCVVLLLMVDRWSWGGRPRRWWCYGQRN